MNLQFIHDNKGNTTGVFIPIEEWQSLKTKYADLQKEETENVAELAPWQKKIIDERLSDYYKSPDDVVEIDETIKKLKKAYGI
jgi:hypothetical protein